MHFLPPRKDVEFYYAAADLYAGPSLEDTFALPAAEAMACGLPVIISSRAGASELIKNGIDGLILDDPTDAQVLATMIRNLYGDIEFRSRLGRGASETARKYTWEQSSRELRTIFEDILQSGNPNSQATHRARHLGARRSEVERLDYKYHREPSEDTKSFSSACT